MVALLTVKGKGNEVICGQVPDSYLGTSKFKTFVKQGRALYTTETIWFKEPLLIIQAVIHIA